MDDDRPLYRQPLALLSAVLVVALIASLSWIVLNRGDGTPSAAPAPATSSAPPSAEPAPSGPQPSATASTTDAGKGVDSACGLRGGSTETPSGPMKGVDWQNVDGWYLPVSRSTGPGKRTSDGPWSCYARTPSGAVLAAYTIAMRIDGVAKDWESVVTEQSVPGVGQRARLATGPPTTSEAVTPRGFKLDSYTDDAATITYYLHTQGGGKVGG